MLLLFLHNRISHCTHFSTQHLNTGRRFGDSFSNWIYQLGLSVHEKDLVLCLLRILARCVEVLRQFAAPLKVRSELFEANAEFERSTFCP